MDVDDPVALLEGANDAFSALDSSSLSDDELEALVIGWQRQVTRASAHLARAMADYDTRKAYRSDGSRSAASRLARKTGASVPKLRGQVALGRRLRSMPTVAAALAAGDITEEHARLLGRLAGSPRPAIADAFVACEEQLLAFATTLPFDEFVRALTYWEQCADPDGVEDDAVKQHQSRRLHLSETIGGMFVLDGLLDPVGGTIVATALKRIEKKLFESDWADAKAVHGDDTRLDDLARTPAQRRADALVRIAERAMAVPKGAQRPRPLITVHVGYETFAGRLCELSTGRVVTPGQVLPLVTRADVERAVFDGPERVIELGQRTRFFTGGLRRCIEIAHRYCSHPGCQVPAEDCDIDHVVEYEDGGLTVQENGDPRCTPHNIWKHNEKVRRRKRGKRGKSGKSGRRGRARTKAGREPPPVASGPMVDPPTPTGAETGE